MFPGGISAWKSIHFRNLPPFAWNGCLFNRVDGASEKHYTLQVLPCLICVQKTHKLVNDYENELISTHECNEGRWLLNLAILYSSRATYLLIHNTIVKKVRLTEHYKIDRIWGNAYLSTRPSSGKVVYWHKRNNSFTPESKPIWSQKPIVFLNIGV